MAAPSFVQAGTGVVITTGSSAVTLSGATTGNLVMLVVLHDAGSGNSTSISLGTYSGVNDLAGASGTSKLIWPANPNDSASGGGGTGQFHTKYVAVGRASSSSVSITVTTSSGNDLYCRLYEFSDVNTGTTVNDIIENVGAGIATISQGISAQVDDSGVTTIGSDRLAVQLITVDDDNVLGPMAGATGGSWQEPVDEFASPTGTDGCNGIQLSYVGVSHVTSTSGFSGVQGGSGVGTSEAFAQSFSSGGGGDVTSVNVPLLKTGTPADNLLVSIQADSSGAPSGTDLASASIAASGLTTSAVWRPLTMSCTLSASTTYWLVFQRSGARDTSNYCGPATANVAYSGGAMYRRDSGVWGVGAGGDCSFGISIGTAGTVNGGSYTMVASDGWGVAGFALIGTTVALSSIPTLVTARR